MRSRRASNAVALTSSEGRMYGVPFATQDESQAIPDPERWGAERAVLGELAGRGIFHPTTVSQGRQNPLFFRGLSVRWADVDVIKMPDITRIIGDNSWAGLVGPSGAESQGSVIGLQFASGLNSKLLKLRKPKTGATVAVPHPTADQIPDQRPAILFGPRGYVTDYPEPRPNRWDVVGGG